ncbi:MAG: HAMP domain-containing sensor histidine kinase [Piscinibacter sp.]
MERADRRERFWVVAPFVVAIALLAGLCAAGFQMLSAARAFVGGESLWSKGRAQAVASLRDYVQTGDAADRQRFEQALAVPLGDRRARLALDASPVDLDGAREGFTAGGNDADDIDAMIRLYRYFGRTPFLRESVAAWIEGDQMIDELRALGREAARRVDAGERGAALQPLRERIDALDARVGALEMRFSAALGEASRATERLLTQAVLLLAGTLALAGAIFVQRVLSRQQAQRRMLAEANQRWTLAADGAGVGVFDWTFGATDCTLDPRARRLLGVGEGADQMAVAAARQHIVAVDRDGLDDTLRAALHERGQMFHHRFRVALGPAGFRHLEMSALALPVPEAPPRMVGILRDVDDEMRQAELRLEKEAAERVAQLRMAFLSRLSHELRTPLNAVLGLAQLMRMERAEPLSPGQDRRVGIILDSGAHLLRLVEDVLDISRIDAGTLPLSSEAVDLAAAVETALRLVEPERARCEVQVALALPTALPTLRADRRRLEQVLVNLFSNACKYNRRGGRLHVAAAAADGRVRLSVGDEGRGMSEAQLAQLFQPFVRFDVQTSVPGTGLGLVIVKMLIELMEGRIEVGSTPGQGSRFTIELPVAQAM